MADLGSVSIRLFSPFRVVMVRYYRPIEPVVGDPDKTGEITGNVKILGTNQVNKKVFLYWSVNGKLIDTALTDQNGDYTFSGLDKNTSNYYVVCESDDVAGYQAQVFNKITPA